MLVRLLVFWHKYAAHIATLQLAPAWGYQIDPRTPSVIPAIINETKANSVSRDLIIFDSGSFPLRGNKEIAAFFDVAILTPMTAAMTRVLRSKGLAGLYQ